ncbi:ThuA domain-containing protein [Amycolatopsis sp. PS_44_ISF1]|uniref:ThuA domain-containing protein n=1 Tax=Amycolatopsis sp. PS_44_ISF1 TaxID=2974917 RepID=UPI0028DF04B0|nr:ThuA domain-containing protein [Amycolatopsis sp. PS_44_ISF1]MDT8915869.1 ThuA domain-containing protein [Amycolatopsis sp. PS_44_ISF1]
MPVQRRPFGLVVKVLAFFAACLGLAFGSPALAPSATAATPFKVLAFYSGTYDAAHISFEKEANTWFPRQAAANGFSYSSTTDWDRLTGITPEQYQVVVFLDDQPQSQAQFQGFQRYMDAGGGFFGFHVSAYNDDSTPAYANWFHNDFLGTGRFVSNSWGPTAETLKIENRTHPSTVNLPATIQSSVSEWYSWQNDLRRNPDISVLASLDPSTFPVGDDPSQTWSSGYYPIVWTNKNYKMLYANFGHNKMNYETDTALSSTFAGADQNEFVLDGLRWLGGATGDGGTPPSGGIPPTAWYPVVSKATGKCVDARSAASADGTVIQQYTCNSTDAQQFQFAPTSGGYARVNSRIDPAQVIDVSNVATTDNAGLQLWAYGGGGNQQWQPVSEGGGYYHFVVRHSGKCLTVPGGSAADSVQLVQSACNGGAAQSFHVA